MNELKSAYEIALERIEAREPIPKMTHPLGQHWDQPNRSQIVVDATHALMENETFEKLHDYSCSIPSGVYEGKMWKRASEYVLNPKFWYLMWYGPSDKPDECSINSRIILIA